MADANHKRFKRRLLLIVIKRRMAEPPEVSTLKPFSPAARSPPQSAGERRLACPKRSKAFRAKIGLDLHKRRAHLMTVNAAAASPLVKWRWHEEEGEALSLDGNASDWSRRQCQ